MPKLLYYGWVGQRNLGDEALYAASQSVLPDCTFVRHNDLLSQALTKVVRATPGAPMLLSAVLGDRRARLPISAVLHRPLGGILGGGTFLLHENPRVIDRIGAIVESMPFVIFGAGVRTQNKQPSDHRPEVDVRPWRAILDASSIVTVRGPHSQLSLQQLGLRHANIVGDPVLSLAAPSPVRRRGRRVGINVGDTAGRLWGGDDAAVHDWIASLVRRLLGDGFEVTLVSVRPSDTPALRRIAQEFSGRAELISFYSYGPSVLKAFQTFDLFVGQKMHSVVLAHCAYTPAIMLEYEPKCADYMASMDLDRFNFRCDRLDLPTVLDALASLRADSDAHQDALRERVRHYQALQLAFADSLRTILGVRTSN